MRKKIIEIYQQTQELARRLAEKDGWDAPITSFTAKSKNRGAAYFSAAVLCSRISLWA